MFERHVPAKWKDRAPRLLTKQDGSNVWWFENQQVPNVGLNAVAGRPRHIHLISQAFDGYPACGRRSSLRRESSGRLFRSSFMA